MLGSGFGLLSEGGSPIQQYRQSPFQVLPCTISSGLIGPGVLKRVLRLGGEFRMRRRFTAIGILLALLLASGLETAQGASAPVSDKKFGVLADRAIAAMKARAVELKVGGVAVVAYAPGDSIQGWNSKMAVVGRMKDEPSATQKGSNLLGIAYAKASEMADTLKNSGNAGRPPMTGEFGWQGGAIGRAKTGYVIAAFSGGKSEDDFEISKAGLAVLSGGL
jgi:hypothetical protein